MWYDTLPDRFDLCSVIDNLRARPQLIFNFITLAVIFAVFIIEYWRENFLITCLDIDKCFPPRPRPPPACSSPTFLCFKASLSRSTCVRALSPGISRVFSQHGEYYWHITRLLLRSEYPCSRSPETHAHRPSNPQSPASGTDTESSVSVPTVTARRLRAVVRSGPPPT